VSINYVTTVPDHGDDIWAHFASASPTEVRLTITMSAEKFEDEWGSWLAGPWPIKIEQLGPGLNKDRGLDTPENRKRSKDE
jgi:hypothetical protein